MTVWFALKAIMCLAIGLFLPRLVIALILGVLAASQFSCGWWLVFLPLAVGGLIMDVNAIAAVIDS